MDTDDSRVGSSPPEGADQLSRRQALRRLGLGVAGGAALWAAPEILIGWRAGLPPEGGPAGRGGAPTPTGGVNRPNRPSGLPQMVQVATRERQTAGALTGQAWRTAPLGALSLRFEVRCNELELAERLGS